MSTVSNPYTFNIKSNCGFSTNPLISNNQVKITMKYTYSEKSEDEEDPDNGVVTTYNYTVENLSFDDLSNNKVGSMIPNMIDGNIVKMLFCENTYGDVVDWYGLLYIVKSNQKYSKAILNGGIFKNCIFPHDPKNDTSGLYCFSKNLIDDDNSREGIDWSNWKDYDKTPFDLTIKFVK